MSTWKSGLQLSRGTSTGGHNKEMMRSRKNKPSRAALLPRDVWQLPAAQEPAEPLSPMPRTKFTLSQDVQQGSSSLSETHRLPEGNCFDRPGKAWASQDP